jgi:hypothetical protein
MPPILSYLMMFVTSNHQCLQIASLWKGDAFGMINVMPKFRNQTHITPSSSQRQCAASI